MCDNPDLELCYVILGLDHIPEDKREVKRAYARKLKQIDQVADAEGFQSLRGAYEAALSEFGEKEITHSGQIQLRDRINQIKSTKEADPAYSDNHVSFDDHNVDYNGDVVDYEDEDLDWHSVEHLCKQIPSSTRMRGSDENRIRQIISNPIFDDPQAASVLEAAIFQYFMDSHEKTEQGIIQFKSNISDNLIEVIDGRFGWFSDYAMLQRNFPESDILMAAYANRVQKPGLLEGLVDKMIILLDKLSSFFSGIRLWVLLIIPMMVLNRLFSTIYFLYFVIGIPVALVFILSILMVSSFLVRNIRYSLLYLRYRIEDGIDAIKNAFTKIE